MISYKDYAGALKEFFFSNGWDCVSHDDEIVFTKKYNSTETRKIHAEYLLDDKTFGAKVTESFKILGIQQRLPDSIFDKNLDTDFIVAGLQLADKDLKKEPVKRAAFYSFHPVVRLKRLDLCGKEEGILSSFVNLCSVDIDTSLEEYISRVNSWISILSNISLHVSGLKIAAKKIKKDRVYNGVPFCNGLKLKFSYKDIDIAVANLFTVNCADKTILVSDFGASYERLIWCINGKGNFFKPIYPNFEVLYGDYVKNDRLRTATLMCMSGILPGSKGINQKLRDLIKGATKTTDNQEIKQLISYYYAYYSKFVRPQKELRDIISVIETEMDQIRKQIISGKTKIAISNKSVNDICGDILLEKERLRRKSVLQKIR